MKSISLFPLDPSIILNREREMSTANQFDRQQSENVLPLLQKIYSLESIGKLYILWFFFFVLDFFLMLLFQYIDN